MGDPGLGFLRRTDLEVPAGLADLDRAGRDLAGLDLAGLADPAGLEGQGVMGVMGDMGPADLGNRAGLGNRVGRADLAGLGVMTDMGPADLENRAGLEDMTLAAPEDREVPNQVGPHRADRVQRARDLEVRGPSQGRAHLDRMQADLDRERLGRNLPDPGRMPARRDRMQADPDRMPAHLHLTPVHPHRIPTHPGEATHLAEVTRQAVVTHLAEAIADPSPSSRRRSPWRWARIIKP